MNLTRSAIFASLFLTSAAIKPAAAQTPQLPSTGSAVVSLSEPWQQTLQGFDDWAHLQQMYTPKQIVEMRRKVVEKATTLAPAAAEQYRADLNAKLQVLFSAEARDARKWLANTLAVASDSYAQKIRAKLPDVANESASQIRADLDAFESRETNVKQFEKGLQEAQQAVVKATEEANRRQEEANAQAHVGTNYNPAPGGAAIGGPGAYGRYYSPYRTPMPYGLGFRWW